ncbi:ABC transporter ATP-binding protein [Caballeronia sp. LZ032]|uniref:ABC transporter ATP-binding protein n=1 Tax=Caballeronia sp. LZ032 TaxID=3038565 RepID=UPI002857BA36|nr:ABC transporter ATP-binding protein [Caballeronia sp. LZ032]MDR5881555.1 ABC transporter ATP-binding protein [Caballeronia sp. LZ032]
MNTALSLRGIAKSFGGVKALSGVDLDVGGSEILGLIGPNGSGKTTLVNVISGFVRPDKGVVSLGDAHALTGLQPHRIVRSGVTRTFQNLRIFKRRTVLDNVLLGQTPKVSLGEILNPLLTAQVRARRRDAREWLQRFNLDERAEAIAGSLSFGEQKRLELARALANGPQVLLLDEPAGGMNPSEIEELKVRLREVRASGVAILLIEHNMKLVMELCDRIAVLAHGSMITTGTPDAVRRDERVIRSYLGEE